MKRLIILIALIMCFSANVNAYAENSETPKPMDMLADLNIIDKDGFSDPEAVSRKECLISVMRAIGATDEGIDSLGKTYDLFTFADTKTRSYFGCAYVSHIAYGEECAVSYLTYRTQHTRKNTEIFFFPDRAVTLKEALAFMVRCLEPGRIELESAFEKAKDYGLIKADEELIQNADSQISQNEYCILLERFLHQKRYMYYNSKMRMQASTDEEHSITYLVFLTDRKEKSVAFTMSEL